MKIVSWNCRGGFHAKWDRLIALAPDVAIVQECAAPDVLRRKAPDFAYRGSDWHGTDSSRGLAVFTFGEWTLSRDTNWSDQYHNFLPERLSGPFTVNLLAVWAFNARAKKVIANPSDTRGAIAYYRPFLSKGLAIAGGDFNASVLWDRPRGRCRFSDLNADLRALGLTSGYHTSTADEFGKESAQTHFHVSGHAFHIDYIFRPIAASTAIASVGARDDWRAISDHTPVSLEFTPLAV